MNATSAVSPTARIVECHQVVRLIAASPTGGIPDLLASNLLKKAGFVSEESDERFAYRGAKSGASNLHAVYLTLNAKRGGVFKLVRLQDGGEEAVESGRVTLLQRSPNRILMNGSGGAYFSLLQMTLDPQPFAAQLSPSSPPPLPSPPESSPQQSSAEPAKLEAVELLVAEIESWPDQPRTQFKERPLAELAQSMAGLVQVQPILVRPFKPGENRLKPMSKYQIVDGERRWRAAVANQAKTIKAIIVYPADIVEQHRLSVIANMHRAKHSHYEFARAVIFQYDRGRSAEQIAGDFSKSRKWVYDYLDLKQLRPELFELLNPTVGEERQLPFKFACVLAKVQPEKQVAVLEQAREEGKPRGPRGIWLRLNQLAEENLSATGQSGRKRKQDDRGTRRTVNRALAAVDFHSRTILELADKFKASPHLAEPGARAIMAAQAKAAAEVLEQFSKTMLA